MDNAGARLSQCLSPISQAENLAGSLACSLAQELRELHCSARQCKTHWVRTAIHNDRLLVHCRTIAVQCELLAVLRRIRRWGFCDDSSVLPCNKFVCEDSFVMISLRGFVWTSETFTEGSLMNFAYGGLWNSLMKLGYETRLWRFAYWSPTDRLCVLHNAFRGLLHEHPLWTGSYEQLATRVTSSQQNWSSGSPAVTL